MFYILAEENDLHIQKYNNNEQVSKMDLFSDIDVLSENTMLGQMCPSCGKMCSNYHWAPPREAKFFSSRYPDMLLYKGSGLIFSEKAKKIIETNNLSGILSFEKIEIKGKYIPSYDYFDTIVNFSDMKIDWKNSVFKKSDIKIYSNCETCGLFIDHIHKLNFETENFKGNDIFQLYCMPSHFIVSEKFFSAFKTKKLANIRFIPIKSYSF